MNILDRIIKSFEVAGRARTLQILRGLSDRQLEDAGLSRGLLDQGLKAWPWRVEETTSFDLATMRTVQPETIVAAIEPAVNDAANLSAQPRQPEFDTAA